MNPKEAETKPHRKQKPGGIPSYDDNKKDPPTKPDLKVVEKPEPKIRVIDRVLERVIEYRVRQIIEVGHGKDAKKMEKRAIIREYIRARPECPLLPAGEPEYEFILIPMRQGMLPLTVKMETYKTLEEVFQHGFDIAEKAYEEMERRQRQAALARGVR